MQGSPQEQFAPQNSSRRPKSGRKPCGIRHCLTPIVTAAASLLPILGTADTAMAASHRAICSYYTRYEPCTVVVGNSQLEASLPTDHLSIDHQNYINAKIYEDIGKESNILVGAATTVLFGPVGLLGFFVTKKAGTIDYAIEFRDDTGRKRTAFIRFVNLKAADSFGRDLKGFLQSLQDPAQPAITGPRP